MAIFDKLCFKCVCNVCLKHLVVFSLKYSRFSKQDARSNNKKNISRELQIMKILGKLSFLYCIYIFLT